MPELPEVETVRRGLEPALLGRRIKDVILRRPDLRGAFPKNFRQEISGQKVMKLERRGKYILAVLENGEGFGLHLGMSGRIKIQAPSRDQDFGLHDHVIFVMEDDVKIIFNDPRRFGQLFKIGPHWDSEKPFAKMGPEPLDENFLKTGFGVKLKNKKAPIKTALLDQNIVAGVGNIYACEALFEAGISPLKKAGAVSSAQIEKLVRAIQSVLNKAIKAGGSTLRDHRKTNGEMGYFQHHFSVYDREGKACPGCGCNIAKTGGIRRIAQAGRSTFYCPRKQK
ncbi:MAG: bifunctional DNA-formamidopyrimidine glycosylase/DNA-(apurinic or apyrimidinic site) lyase [Alphaproteobacteria bacterium]|jgi:formamidopyrimidine-DNA glycosylase|nr:bifunctional DNA-formamidopyrimidine glycosylase/DNA-(apurinic or apyrimidinic site) lyase [Alphaproteobacteria bacterium]